MPLLLAVVAAVVLGAPAQAHAAINATFDTYLQPSQSEPGSSGFDYHFGWSVAASGDSIAVGEPLSHAVHVYGRSTSGWSSEATLSGFYAPSATDSGLALSGDTLVARGGTGSPVTFIRSGSSWSSGGGLALGPCVATNGQTIATWDGWYLWIYDWSGTGWVPDQVPPVPFTLAPGAARSIAMSNDTILVGTDSETGPAVYVFAKSNGVWQQQAKLVSPGSGDAFGASVAVSGDAAIVGAPDASLGPGHAYVFGRTGSEWSLEAVLTGSHPTSLSDFGAAVALDGDVAVVGDDRDDSNGVAAGCAYVYQRAGSDWVEQQLIVSPSPTSMSLWDGLTYGPRFGCSVALSGSTLVVGAYHDLSDGILEGGAYVYSLAYRYDDTDPRIAYTGSWQTFGSGSTNYFAGTGHGFVPSWPFTERPDATVAFNGTAISWVGIKGPYSGIAAVTVDGGVPHDVDLYAPDITFRDCLYSVTGLAPGPHVLNIAYTGRSNPLAMWPGDMTVDAFDIAGVLTELPPRDTTPPTTTSNAAGSYTGTATITLTAIDTESVVASTHWRLDGSDWVSGTVVTTGALGPHRLDFYSTDAAGNREVTHTVGFSVLLGAGPCNITGVLTGLVGEPLDRMVATAFDAASHAFVKAVFTDGTGRYVLGGLPAGSYHLRFLTSGGSPVGAYPYYSSAGAITSAATVTVAAGEIATASQRMTPAPPVGVSGTITNGGLPCAGIVVSAFDANTHAYVKGVFTSAIGAYSLTLLPGAYHLRFTGTTPASLTQYFDHKGVITEAATVTVTSGGTTSVSSDLAPREVVTQTIAGTITNGALPCGGIVVSAFDATTHVYVKGVFTSASGTYALTLPPGAYHLRFTGTTPASLTQYFDHKITISTATTVTLPPASTVTVDSDLSTP